MTRPRWYHYLVGVGTSIIPILLVLAWGVHLLVTWRKEDDYAGR